MSRHGRSGPSVVPQRVLASSVVLASALVVAAGCSRSESPPAEISVEDAAAALGGPPHGSEPDGPSLVRPEEFEAQ